MYPKIGGREAVSSVIQEARSGNAGLDGERQTLVQAGALLPPDREFSAEGFIDGDAQFAELYFKITEFEVELNYNLARYGQGGDRVRKTKIKLARKPSIC
ncbi:MAG: hypothetical protein PVI27_04845 [Desulfobacteraceae bacterium]|jgi:hypothetical protein